MAIDDLVDVLCASLVNGQLTRATVAVTGAEQLPLSEAVRRVARVMQRRVWIMSAPVWCHYVLARAFELTMKVPLVALAQVRILAEGVVDAAPPADALPDHLQPRRMFTDTQIRAGQPEAERFSLRDLRCCHRPAAS